MAGGKDEIESTRRRHAEYFLGLAEKAELNLWGTQQAKRVAALEREHDNLRAALRWSLDTGEAELGLRLCEALCPFWDQRGHLTKGRQWLDEVLSRGDKTPTRRRALVLYGAGLLASRQCDFKRAVELVEASLTLGRAMGLDEAVAYALEAADQDGPGQPGSSMPSHLTLRERDVAILIARGLSNHQIAAALVISKRTADGHVGNILGKLGFSSRAQIAAWAVEQDLAGPAGLPYTFLIPPHNVSSDTQGLSARLGARLSQRLEGLKNRYQIQVFVRMPVAQGTSRLIVRRQLLLISVAYSRDMSSPPMARGR